MTTETLDKPIKSAGYFTDGVAAVDPAVAAAMKHELERERYQIELIASAAVSKMKPASSNRPMASSSR